MRDIARRRAGREQHILRRVQRADACWHTVAPKVIPIGEKGKVPLVTTEPRRGFPRLAAPLAGRVLR